MRISNFKFLLSLFCIVLLLEGCGLFRRPPKKPVTQKKAELIQPLYIKEDSGMFDYFITAHDKLDISVWEDEELDTEAIVRPDGKINLRLIGEVEAAGKTVIELNYLLNKRYRKYIKSPQVLVTIKEFGGTKVIVLGEVDKPGVYKPVGRAGILEAIAMAGGFTEGAVVSSVILIRGDLNNPQTKRLNLSKAIIKAKKDENIAVESNDVIYVPKKFIANVAYFFEEYLQPILTAATSGKSVITPINK